jgi:arylsulfatase A-like enzyme
MKRATGKAKALPYVLLVLLIAAIVAAIALRHLATRRPAGHVPSARSGTARHLVLVTIDTLRADHVGAYGYRGGTSPTLDRIARDGVRFDRAYAPAPITLASHASMLTGRYPAGHGARDNLMPVSPAVPTLATVLHEQGFQTGAFIAAFPLDHRFGLSRGFDIYSDRMPRGPGGKLLNERPGRQVVDEALAWLDAHRSGRIFLWVHLFEPHSPYGDPAHAAGRSTIERYDDEIRTADGQVGRLLDGLGAALADAIVIVVGDHGEAFGEHGEIGHSIFVYDTTLHVPWVMMGPGITARAAAITDPVCLIDLAPTLLALLGTGTIDADGVDLRPLLDGGHLAPRDLYAESFAPLVDFGWSPLRALRSGAWKAIAAPRPELYDIERDPHETTDVAALQPDTQKKLADRIARYSAAELPQTPDSIATSDREAAARLRALGYVQGTRETATAGTRADPKDRRELAARMGLVVSGELQGKALEDALRAILTDDPGNPQAHLRLGDCLLDRGQWAEAATHFGAAIAGDLPSVDAYLGLAACQSALERSDAAERTLRKAHELEPANPVVIANIGIMESGTGRSDAAIKSLTEAVTIDPDFHEARFNLALAYARAGRRQDAERETRDLLARLPADAPQRPEVERLLAAVRR